ncbi:NAD-binding protein [Streptomyces sp. NBC_00347]|uniref:NAD-binding protein n=1 Tax=Streptomyces sp. NBC_00347 TaxID=2975721 RepID=UPI002250017D|nr:NAD-binding protein [Streptomyces sp. NBC_00347]MCX5124606.1 NAD-binding protein [Streptomyces sp. NBC_00347]
MIVCGDDALAVRLAGELHDIYRQPVTLLLPDTDTIGPQPPATTRIVEADTADAAALREAGIAQATALALVYEDDETNIRAALTARRINPRVRLVIRLYNRKLGRYLAELLDQAAVVAGGQAGDSAVTVLSDADTAAPALAATVVAGTSKVLQADGLLFRAIERTPQQRREATKSALCTLALLSSTTEDPAGAEGTDASGPTGPRLLPAAMEIAQSAQRGAVVLEAVSHAAQSPAPGRLTSARLPLMELFSRRVRWSLAGFTAAVIAIAITSWITTGDPIAHSAYITLLDLFSINDPAVEDTVERQLLQLFTGLVGLLLLPVLVAAVLEASGSFRSASALRRPPRGTADHIVLLGLGKIGTRVLARLRELDIPVVCVEEDPEARGIPLARSLRVPVILGDVTQDGILEAARIHRAHALLALTSSDTTNLEAILCARTIHPDLRVALRLYDDEFATAVHRTLRTAHPQAVTRSRSVTSLAAPAFAAAMMGRQILGALPVERRVLLFAAIDVAGVPQLDGRTIADTTRPGHWRVLALDTADPSDRRPDLRATRLDGQAHVSGLLFDLHPGHVLGPDDRVIIAATRQGLAELLGNGP